MIVLNANERLMKVASTQKSTRPRQEKVPYEEHESKPKGRQSSDFEYSSELDHFIALSSATYNLSAHENVQATKRRRIMRDDNDEGSTPFKKVKVSQEDKKSSSVTKSLRSRAESKASHRSKVADSSNLTSSTTSSKRPLK